MDLPLFQLDAFADRLFAGNPAAVLLLPPDGAWPSDDVLQAVAAENNLSETAFLHPVLPDDAGDPPAEPAYHLRWFTPVVEVDLCGHATLASAGVLFDDVHPDADAVRFWTRSGWLHASRPAPGRVTLDFPAASLQQATVDPVVREATGVDPVECLEGMDVFLVLATAQEVRDARPDQARLAALPTRGVVVTAPGDEDGVDVVSRFFGAAAGIGEDPVTGSAHSQFARYWAARLGRTSFRASQLSARGGTVDVELAGDRALLTGSYHRFLDGIARLPEAVVTDTGVA